MWIKKLLKWRQDQKNDLETLGGDLNTHIVLAIDEYIKRRIKKTSAVFSPSRKGGQDGRSTTS